MTSEEVRKCFYYKEGNLYNKKYKDEKPIGYISKKGYRIVEIKNKSYRVHRLIWLYFNENIPDEIDHINGIKTDNRIENLRNVSRFENMNNLSCHRNGKKAGIKKRWNKYAAYFTKNKIIKYIGLFDSEKESVNAREMYIIAMSSY